MQRRQSHLGSSRIIFKLIGFVAILVSWLVELYWIDVFVILIINIWRNLLCCHVDRHGMVDGLLRMVQRIRLLLLLLIGGFKFFDLLREFFNNQLFISEFLVELSEILRECYDFLRVRCKDLFCFDFSILFDLNFIF